MDQVFDPDTDTKIQLLDKTKSGHLMSVFFNQTQPDQYQGPKNDIICKRNFK